MDLNTLIQYAHHQLVVFLQGKLPDISDENWWEDCVRSKLTDSQFQILEEKKIDCLEKLDFPSLLRVLNKNWWELKAKFNLLREDFTLVNEMMHIRNRYAHISDEGIDLNNQLRDCDTLARFLTLIDADKKNITMPCSDLWRRMFVWWDGKVAPCDVDYLTRLSNESITNSSVSEIWNGNMYKELRNKHLAGERASLEPCSRCVVV